MSQLELHGLWSLCHVLCLFSVPPACPQLEFGVIYHCTEERLYTGRRGQGAFCNGQRLRVSGETGGPSHGKGPIKSHWLLRAATGVPCQGLVSLGTAHPWRTGRRASQCLCVSLCWAGSVLHSAFHPKRGKEPSHLFPSGPSEPARARAESEACSGIQHLSVAGRMTSPGWGL